MRVLLGALVAAIFFSFTASSVTAASLYIDPAFPKLYRGDTVKLAVRLDTNEAERECINAIDGVLTYTENLVPVDISLGDSIFSVWVEEPVINLDERTITFAGGIPNGYCGRVEGDPRLTNTILEIILRSPGFIIGSENAAPVGEVSFAPETSLYLNDGLGTQVDATAFGAKIELSQEPGPTLQSPWTDEVAADQIPPESFGISLERDETTFRGKYYIVFNTTDKQTGVDEYQVMEEPLEQFSAFGWGRADAPWITARSPYQLKDQSLNSTIRVRAIDKAGNEYVATLVPDQALRTLSTQRLFEYLIIAAVTTLMLVSAGFAYWLYRRRRSASLPEDEVADNH